MLLIFLLSSSLANSLVLVESVEHSDLKQVDSKWLSSLGVKVWADYVPENEEKERVRLVFHGNARDHFYDYSSVLLIIESGDKVIARINSVDLYRFSITLHEDASIRLYIKLDKLFGDIEPGWYVFHIGSK